MLCDYYELTMTNGYYACGMQNRITYFDIFFRSVPDGGGFAIAAGLEQAIHYIQQLHFDEDDIAYLRGRKMFSEGFLESLRNYRFTGDIWAVPEGTPIFPNEPIMTVRAPAIEAQIIETFLLLTLNHQSLIATKANRVTRAAQGRTVLELVRDGRRAAMPRCSCARGVHRRLQGHGLHADGRAVRRAGRRHDGPFVGADVRQRVRRFKDLLRDLPGNAICWWTPTTRYARHPKRHRAFDEVLRRRAHEVRHPARQRRHRPISERRAKCSTRRLGDGDHHRSPTRSTSTSSAICGCRTRRSTSFGVGERLITARSEPVFGCVYKLVAVEDKDGNVVPRSRSARTSARSPRRISRSSTASTAATRARPSRTTCALRRKVDDSDK